MRGRRLAIIAITVVAGTLGVVSGCGGDDDELSQEEFSTQLQSIIQEPSEAFEPPSPRGREAQAG